MRTWTYTEAKTKVLNDLDLSQDGFVTSQEVIDLFNEGIDEAEAEIHKTHEDYFLKRDVIELVSGTQDYALPADIYANKIRKMFYVNGSERYRISKLKRMTGLEVYEDELAYGSQTNRLRYLITNDAATGPRISFVPIPLVDGEYIKIWYLRNATRIVDGTESLDIPEFANFVMTFVKAKIREKMNGGVMPADQAALVQQQRDMMVSTLENMIEDDDDEVEMDISIYEEHS